MRRCTNHCSACGSHFTSLAAFDAHRSGPYDGERVCWAEDNERASRLAIVEPDGTCDLTAEMRQGVSLWGDPEAAAGVRSRFAAQALRNEIQSSGREAA